MSGRRSIEAARGREPGALSPAERVGSLAGGALLAGWALRAPTPLRLLGAALGGGLLWRGARGRCAVKAALERGAEPVEVRAAVTIARTPWDVYAGWRRLEDLPRFMHHLERVEVLDARRSRWTARAPRGFARARWEAELVVDEEPTRIAWRSLPGGDVETAGEVTIVDAPGGRGTELHLRLELHPPAGALGGAAARLLRPSLARVVREDVRRFKQLLEAGELPSTAGQPSGRGAPARAPAPRATPPRPSAVHAQELTEGLTDERPWTASSPGEGER